MLNVFDQNRAAGKLPWLTLGVANEKLLEKLNNHQSSDFLNKHANKLAYRLSPTKRTTLATQHKQWLSIVSRKLHSLTECMFTPFVFIITDLNGTILDIHAQTDIIQELDLKYNLGTGTSLAWEHAGVNAISLSKKTGKCTFMYGEEHDMRIFHQWSCICSPLKFDNQIVGYLDMSFSTTEDELLAGSIFQMVYSLLAAELNINLSIPLVHASLDTFPLSPREREVADRWLMNHSVLRISSELDIKEGTVRNMLKQIYRKTKSGDKGQFIRKFLVASHARYSQ